VLGSLFVLLEQINPQARLTRNRKIV